MKASQMSINLIPRSLKLRPDSPANVVDSDGEDLHHGEIDDPVAARCQSSALGTNAKRKDLGRIDPDRRLRTKVRVSGLQIDLLNFSRRASR